MRKAFLAFACLLAIPAAVELSSTVHAQVIASEARSDLTKQQVEKAKYCVNHHSLQCKGSDYYKIGATRINTVDKDQDEYRYWTLSVHPEITLLTDLNDDGRGDAVTFVKCDGDYHLVVLMNKSGMPGQTCDFLLNSKEVNPDTPKFESGILTVSWFDYTTNKSRSAKFKIANDKLVQIEPSPEVAKQQGWKFEELTLTENPQDVVDPKIPKRIPEMIETEPIDTGIKATALSKAIVLNGLKKVSKRLELIDEYNGFGSIDSITFGDLNGDGVKDAVVIFGIDRADNTQLLLIPAVVDAGKLRFVGSTCVGRGGFDTSKTLVQINSGVISAKVETFERHAAKQAKDPWVTLRFKLYKGNKLIKLK